MDKKIDTRTSNLIVETAFRLFLEKGYEATNLREIGMESGINASSIYFYYASKKELFLKILEKTNQSQVTRLKQKTKECTTVSGRDALKALFKLKLETFLKDSASYRFLFRYRLFPVVELSAEIREIHGRFEQAEFEIWKPYILAYLRETENIGFQSEYSYYVQIRKLTNALINEMLFSGEVLSDDIVEFCWKQFFEFQ